MTDGFQHSSVRRTLCALAVVAKDEAVEDTMTLENNGNIHIVRLTKETDHPAQRLTFKDVSPQQATPGSAKTVLNKRQDLPKAFR